MSRTVNSTAIGAFILGALILTIMGVIFLSPGVGEDRERYELYFIGSVRGLSVGAPVLIKGVRVGTVREIDLRMHSNTHDRNIEYIVPVVVEISRSRILADAQHDLEMSDLIDRGLRALLELDSFVTQQMFVQLTFRPDTEAVFYGQHISEFPQIPTVKTGWQELQEELTQIDITDIIKKTTDALDGVSQLVNAPETMQTLISLNNLITGLNEDREVLSTSLQSTLAEAHKTFSSARQALSNFEQLSEGGHDLMSDSQELVQQLQSVATNLNAITAEDSPTIHRVESALDEITDTAKTLGRFLEMLERKPNALILGM